MHKSVVDDQFSAHLERDCCLLSTYLKPGTIPGAFHTTGILKSRDIKSPRAGSDGTGVWHRTVWNCESRCGANLLYSVFFRLHIWIPKNTVLLTKSCFPVHHHFALKA